MQESRLFTQPITPAHPVYGSISADSLFNVTARGVLSDDPNILSHGEGIRMTAGNSVVILRATSAFNKEHDGEFNSPSSLVKAINSLNGVFLAYMDGNLLCVTSTDGSYISIEDYNPLMGRSIVDTLGFHYE